MYIFVKILPRIIRGITQSHTYLPPLGPVGLLGLVEGGTGSDITKILTINHLCIYTII